MSASGSNGRYKILLVLTTTLGGTGLHAYHLAKDLNRSKFDVALAYGPGQPLDRDIERLGVPIHHLSMVRSLSPFTNLRGLIQLYRLMRREKFDLVCSQCSIAGCLARVAAKMAGVPVSIFIIQLYASHDYVRPMKRRLYLWIERVMDLFTDHYVAVSHAMKEEGLRKRIVPQEKVSVIYNAIDPRPYDQAPARNARRSLGIDPDCRVVGTISRLERQKGIPYLLRAIALVREAVPDVRALIVGDGPLRTQMEDLAHTLGVARNVMFTGWRRDTADLLACMDVFCLCSLWESFGFVLVEAMAMKRPVVATRVGGIPEVVEDGRTGFLVSPEDPDALAQKVLTLLRDPALARRFGEAGRTRMEEHFSIGRMVAKYEGLFSELADRRSGGSLRTSSSASSVVWEGPSS